MVNVTISIVIIGAFDLKRPASRGYSGTCAHKQHALSTYWSEHESQGVDARTLPTCGRNQLTHVVNVERHVTRASRPGEVDRAADRTHVDVEFGNTFASTHDGIRTYEWAVPATCSKATAVFIWANNERDLAFADVQAWAENATAFVASTVTITVR